MFSLKQLRQRIKRYLRENFGVPFVAGFQVLLLVCAGLLVYGNSGLANEVAVCAYYSLVAGIVLQLICFVRYGKKQKETEEGITGKDFKRQ